MVNSDGTLTMQLVEEHVTDSNKEFGIHNEILFKQMCHPFYSGIINFYFWLVPKREISIDDTTIYSCLSSKSDRSDEVNLFSLLLERWFASLYPTILLVRMLLAHLYICDPSVHLILLAYLDQRPFCRI